MRQVQVIIRGRVQGVGYRMATERQAQLRGLTGWVRNVPSGDVEALLEGDHAQIEAMLLWCEEGPALARVQTVQVVADREIEEVSQRGFAVRYA